MKSYLTHLECTYCQTTYSADEPHRTCDECGKVLYPRYDLEAAKAALSRDMLKERPANMWRYFEVMPILDEANVITLGEGFTPIFKTERLGREFGCTALYIKDEGVNPTASFKARGIMRRFSAVLHHRRAGFTANSMAVWKVPEERSVEVGNLMAQSPWVTHCYERPTYPDWEYTHFTMIHATSTEKCEEVAREISQATGISDYMLLYSSREYKKTRVRYFV